jgi:hypothetical protein
VSNPLDTERIQFFLRHRDDILEWAGIEREVTVATRELLAGLQPMIVERLANAGEAVSVSRRDGGRYERILVQRPGWPAGVGIALEWETGVDPFGRSVPKHGPFVLSSDPAVAAAHATLDRVARASTELATLGYKSGDGVWPVVQYLRKSSTWWQDPEDWLTPIADAMVGLWPIARPMIDSCLGADIAGG